MLPKNEDRAGRPLSRRCVLNAAMTLTASSAFRGFVKSAWASDPPTTPQPIPSGPMTEMTLGVGGPTGASVGSAFAGFSHEKGSISGKMSPTMRSQILGLYKLLGPSILRLGGDTVDHTVWDPNGAGNTPDRIAPSDVDATAELIKAAGWKCLYGVNLGGIANGTTSPALAASEVAYAARAFGPALYGIEIGNEVDSFGKGGHAFANREWNLDKFIEVWKVFRATILASTPNVLVTGPAAAGNVSGWTIPFGETVTKGRLGLLTQHYYRANKRTSPTVANLVSPDPKLVALLAELKAGADKIGIPFRMAEVNSYSAGGAPGVSNTYASALWVVDFLFNCAQGGSTGADFHGGGDGPRYQPIATADGRITEIRPLFHGMYFFTLAGRGALCDVKLSAGALNVTGYAVKTSSGMNVVIVNKEETNVHLKVQLPADVRSATLLEMTQGSKQPDLSATSGVIISGASIETDGSFKPKPSYNIQAKGNQLDFYVPALSAVILKT